MTPRSCAQITDLMAPAVADFSDVYMVSSAWTVVGTRIP